MTLRDPAARALSQALDEALRLVSGVPGLQLATAADPAPLPSLLDECEALTAAPAAAEGPFARTIHHFACTGGTLIARCLAAMPNTVLLSEIDPLSTLPLSFGKPPYAPMDLLLHLRIGLRPLSDADAVEVFLAALAEARARLGARGLHPVLRDHSHSQFCTDADPAGRPTLREMLAARGPVLSAVTVRHPMESFLSLDANGWRHFAPFTIDAYARRYLDFLDRHDGLPVFRYEDLTESPAAILARLCAALAVPFSEGALDILPAVARSDPAVIAPRARKPVPGALAAEAAASAAYTELCSSLGYAAE
jgi:hypothetical protein